MQRFTNNLNGRMYRPPPGQPTDQLPSYGTSGVNEHKNAYSEAARIRAADEQQMQNLLQTAQLESGIYNSEVEPEHDTEGYCGCSACRYKWAKRNRQRVHEIWSNAVKYPGEKNYNDNYGGQKTGMPGSGLFLRNPYQSRVVSPYGAFGPQGNFYYRSRPDPEYHMRFIHQTIDLNRELNDKAQAAIDAQEPAVDIWAGMDDAPLDFSKLSLDPPPDAKNQKSLPPPSVAVEDDDDVARAIQESLKDAKPPVRAAEDDDMERAIRESLADQKTRDPQTGFPAEGTAASPTAASSAPREKSGGFPSEKQGSVNGNDPRFGPPPTSPPRHTLSTNSANTELPPVGKKPSKLGRLFGSSQVKAEYKQASTNQKHRELAVSILTEEAGRWPNPEWRRIVANYQVKTGMAHKIAQLRRHAPIQYLHLLRAGYFEPIPIAYAESNSNPLKFSIEAAGGWRGITPAWRGYEDTSEERLYWVLNHREGAGVKGRLKPDFISEMNMARERMARAVPPPPEYSDPMDQCHVQHTSEGYSKQVMPSPFHAYDRPIAPSDDTMILLDVSGSMDFDPLRPVYSKYLCTGYTKSTQPKNKVVAKAIIRRFTEALAHHDHLRENQGYDLVTFSTHATYIGRITHQNFDEAYTRVKIGGGTRVMTGWQMVKKRHFEKHHESATYHPIYGWQAGPQTPMLRLLLFLDGEAQDMDEFELDLLGLDWAHVTIFLIGVDGCPHHHRHANELQRISDVNHHVTFVDAQGNLPERYVTHELLKRHLGLDLSMAQFRELEQLPAYSA